MFQKFASTLFVAGLFVCASSSVGFCQEGGQPVGGIGVQPTQIKEAMDEGSMMEKASMIFGYNAAGRLVQNMKTMSIEADAASIVEGARMAIEQQAVTIGPEEAKKLNLIMSNQSIKGMAESLKKQGLELNMSKVLEGIGLAAEEKKLGIENEDVASIMRALQTKVQTEQRAKMAAKMKADGDANKAAGEAFLAKNAAVEGVMKLENGVQYSIITEGTGDKPAPTDKVKLHYHGTKVDGTVFDSSVDKGKPITHNASGFVKGFNAAVQAMPVGSKWKVVIPADLAYGMRGPGAIGPNSTLIFEIELLEIVK